MSTPVLTKRQQRHSLSAKKTPVKGLRNVLAQPHDNFWPLVSKCTQLEDLFKKLAPAAKKSHVKWKSKKNKKDKTLVKRDKSKESEPEKDELVKSVLLGINAITRALEKNAVCCVILDSSIDPPFLVKHVLTMAQNKRVPILVLPSLKVITAASVGVPSAAFALKNVVKETENHHFYPLYKQVEDTFNNLPLPKKSLSLSNKVEKDKGTEFSESTARKNVEPKKFILSTNVYKYRTSRTERAFIPPSAKADKVEKMDCTDLIATNESDTKNSLADDFISISHYDSDKEESVEDQEMVPASKKVKREKGGIQYLSLKVKRIQGNRNRVKATKAAKPKKK